MKTALYVGSFDPITLGHLDIIRQAQMVFDTIYVGIGVNAKKTPTGSTEQRIDMVHESLRELGMDENVIVGNYDGSLMQAARDINADAIVRGLRQISDFGDEFTINGMVSRTLPQIPMIYFICRQDFLHVSSSSVKEMWSLGEDFDWMVTDNVKRVMEQTSK